MQAVIFNSAPFFTLYLPRRNGDKLEFLLICRMVWIALLNRVDWWNCKPWIQNMGYFTQKNKWNIFQVNPSSFYCFVYWKIWWICSSELEDKRSLGVFIQQLMIDTNSCKSCKPSCPMKLQILLPADTNNTMLLIDKCIYMLRYSFRINCSVAICNETKQTMNNSLKCHYDKEP